MNNTISDSSSPSEQDDASQRASAEFVNKSHKVEQYRDMALGMYLYWTVDAVYGMVNAHSTIGASPEYLKAYFNELPGSFNPREFDADWYARLAKSCGFDYVTVCAKNHNGFCMWPTQTTPFNVTNTPLGRDVLREFIDAFRAVGLPVSFYFSPDDAWFQWSRGQEPARLHSYCLPKDNPDLLAHDQAQLRELIESYQPDMLCFDHKEEEVRELVKFCWSLDPEILITRGVLPTPEQSLSEGNTGPFEAHFTLGTQWQYKAGNDKNKTGREVIELLADIRSRGGTLLLAIGGPDADGRLPRDKDNLVREIGLWNFINQEAMRNTRPGPVACEGRVYYTYSADSDTVYLVDCTSPTKKGEWNELHLKHLQLQESSAIDVLGQSGNIIEYEPEEVPQATWSVLDDGITIRYCRAQRLYNDCAWPNPPVLRIRNAHTTP